MEDELSGSFAVGFTFFVIAAIGMSMAFIISKLRGKKVSTTKTVCFVWITVVATASIVVARQYGQYGWVAGIGFFVMGSFIPFLLLLIGSDGD